MFFEIMLPGMISETYMFRNILSGVISGPSILRTYIALYGFRILCQQKVYTCVPDSASLSLSSVS